LPSRRIRRWLFIIGIEDPRGVCLISPESDLRLARSRRNNLDLDIPAGAPGAAFERAVFDAREPVSLVAAPLKLKAISGIAARYAALTRKRVIFRELRRRMWGRRRLKVIVNLL
jgi:hypothetical protein